MKNCNYTMKAICGAIWCFMGILLFCITLILTVMGHSTFIDALKGLGLGALFIILGGWIARFYWKAR